MASVRAAAMARVTQMTTRAPGQPPAASTIDT